MIWIVMIASGLANFVARYSMFSGFKLLKIPRSLEEYFRFGPTAALSAIIATSVFIDENGLLFEGSASKMYAAMIASCIALLSRSILFTIVAGLSVLWLLG